MENHHPDSIPVQIGEETYYSKLSIRAIDNAETKHGYKIRFTDLQDPSMSSLTRLAWVSFLHDSPDMDFDAFCDLDLDMARVMEVASKAVESLTEGPKKAGSKKVGKRKPRTANKS